MLVGLPLSILAMDGVETKKPFVLIAKDESSKEVGRYEIDFDLAQNIPLMREYIADGTKEVNYSYTTQKNLENFYHYALQRDALRKKPVNHMGEVLQLDDVSNGQKKFLKELPNSELSHLTTMAWQMYKKDIDSAFCEAWQETVASEVQRGKGKTAFLMTYFGDNNELGEHIFENCWQQGNLTEITHNSAIERSQIQQKPEITVPRFSESPEKKSVTFFAKCQAFFGRATRPILGLTIVAACAGLYKLLQQQGLLSF